MTLITQLAHHGLSTTGNLVVESGVYDPYIFKAVHFMGGPASGKSFVYGHMLAGLGLKHINADTLIEKWAKDANIDLHKDLMSPAIQDPQTGIRSKAKQYMRLRESMALHKRMGVVIESTGQDADKMKIHYHLARRLGYDNFLIFVNTSLEVARERNQRRGRSIPESELERRWYAAQQNIGSFQVLFGRNYMHIEDNSETVSEDKIAKIVGPRLRRAALHFLARPIRNKKALNWIKTELRSKGLSGDDIKREFKLITKGTSF